MEKLRRLLRHLWLDADDARHALGNAALDRLEARVRASETGHTGQICLCVEASLPPSYLWRHLARGEALASVIRDRAITLFGKQRVWDTEDNNGVLVYLLLAEHHIEIVADRALARCLAPAGLAGPRHAARYSLPRHPLRGRARQCGGSPGLAAARGFPAQRWHRSHGR
ncbi:hypothetical protein MASR2M50_26190 [Thauera sp.]